MEDNQKVRLNQYQKIISDTKPKRPVMKNAFFAFVIGGLIGLIAEIIIEIFTKLVKLEEMVSNSIMSMIIVLVTAVLTGAGIFDKIGQIAGAGTYIPITGFANSMTSSALESKSEGIVLGIMTNMFKLAGAVIVAGVVSAFVAGGIIFIFR